MPLTFSGTLDRAALRARAALFDYATAVERYAEVLLGQETRAA